MFHRPNEPKRWKWSQQWRDVLFLHWRVPVAALRSHVPAALDIDEFAGSAWVSMVVFRLRVRPRWLPYVPGLSSLVEVNLRTYVRNRDRAGIWFLSVHADNLWAISLANWLTPMSYLWADVLYGDAADCCHFRACRAATPTLAISLMFRASEQVKEAATGSVDEWLLERYRLFILSRRGHLNEAEVSHPPWPVHVVDVSISANTIGKRFDLALSDVPDKAHFSPGVHTRFGAFLPARVACIQPSHEGSLTG